MPMNGGLRESIRIDQKLVPKDIKNSKHIKTIPQLHLCESLGSRSRPTQEVRPEVRPEATNEACEVRPKANYGPGSNHPDLNQRTELCLYPCPNVQQNGENE